MAELVGFGRLWQTLILGQWRNIFYTLPIENTVQKHQQDYYNVLSSADKQADSTIFIEFMLDIILSSISITDPVTDPVEKLLSVMGDEYLSSAQMMAKVGLSHKPTFRENYLLPALKQALIEMSRPDTPNSPKQKYIKK